jgi:hypothetical protein
MDWTSQTQAIAAGVQAIASVVMVVGLYLTKKQLQQAEKLNASNFEDSFATQYREIVHQIPIKALLGESLTDQEIDANLDDFYRYADLCNEQVFLRQKGRIRKETWVVWCEGMRSNFLDREPFAKAWEIIKKSIPDDDFRELKWLEKQEFKADPFGQTIERVQSQST